MLVVGTGNGDDPSLRGWELAQVMHGCRQLVSWDVGLSPETSATPVVSCQRIMPGTLTRLLVNSRRKEGMTSSHHVPYVQGGTHATMGGTKSCETVGGANLIKPPPVRIEVSTRPHEAGIASNRRSAILR